MQQPTQKPDASPRPSRNAEKHRMLVEFGPLVLFFIANAITKDILLATAVLVAATVLAMGYSYFTTRRIPPILAFGAGAVVLFGALALVFDDAVFIKIKPTVVSLLIAGAVALALLFGRNPMGMLMGSMSGGNRGGFNLPRHIWRRLNIIWIVMFCVIAGANEWAWRTLTDDQWVSFKVFGLTAISLGFGVVIAMTLARHGKNNDNN